MLSGNESHQQCDGQYPVASSCDYLVETRENRAAEEAAVGVGCISPSPPGRQLDFPHFAMDRAGALITVVDQNYRQPHESADHHRFGMRIVLHDHERPGRYKPSFLMIPRGAHVVKSRTYSATVLTV